MSTKAGQVQEDQISEGIIEEKEAGEISAQSTLAEFRAFSVTKKEKLPVRREADSKEKLDAVVFALETLLVDLPAMADESLKILHAEGVDSVTFESADGSHELSLNAVAVVSAETTLIKKILQLLRSGEIDEE